MMFLSLKSEEWEYEKEWRILKPLALADRTVPTNEGPIALFEYPPEIIVSVTLGARASQELLDKARSILASNPAYKNVKLLQALPHAAQFRLDFRPLDTEN